MNITCYKHGNVGYRLTSAIIADAALGIKTDIPFEIMNIFLISDSGYKHCYYVDKSTLDQFNLHNGQEIELGSPDFEIFYSGLVPFCGNCLDEYIAVTLTEKSVP